MNPILADPTQQQPTLAPSSGGVPLRPIIEVSERVPVNMHNAYFDNATLDHFWIQWRFEALKQLLGDAPLGQNIMEIGSGNGVVQQQFESWLKVPVHGCDLNYEALLKARPTAGNVYLYNVLDRCYEWQNWCSTILLCDVLEHIDNALDFLAALRYHLAPQGRLVINVPATPWLYSKYDSVQGHKQRYTIERLQGELSLAGFELEKHAYWGANLIPVAAVRKLMVMFMSDDRAMRSGFQPPSQFADGILRSLKWFEQKGIRARGCGTSLCHCPTPRLTFTDSRNSENLKPAPTTYSQSHHHDENRGEHRRRRLQFDRTEFRHPFVQRIVGIRGVGRSADCHHGQAQRSPAKPC